MHGGMACRRLTAIASRRAVERVGRVALYDTTAVAAAAATHLRRGRMMPDTYITTKEHRRSAEFANAVRKEQTIGICHDDAGVGKTNSARRYAH